MSDGLALLALVTFVAALSQGATGFGFGVLVAPFFVLLMAPTAAVQLIAMLSIAMSVLLVPELLRQLDRRLIILLLAGSLAGWPLGLAAHAALGAGMLKLMVGLTTVALAGLLLVGRRGTEAPAALGGPVMLGTGAASGAMTTALAMPGPAVLVAMLAHGRSGEEIRGTLLCLFLVSYALALALHGLTIGVEPGTWTTAAWLVPVSLVGAHAGRLVKGRIDEQLFRRSTLALLLAGGLVAAGDGLRSLG